ncbi:pentapeptide repeat-containing protein [Mycobacterium sp. 852002-50816_SCH5313054-b]|uniref:pentapeptide repeat-containing protein n=1 Tax=Mycobacterium sp. 852002-50816_SCH5313054-b TaxID=1834092 RepID=UPI0009ED5AB9|nr:pentapeptide repeat-containing protein [Mycobacterium sp. 852002-50816_SCH5313054-b]
MSKSVGPYGTAPIPGDPDDLPPVRVFPWRLKSFIRGATWRVSTGLLALAVLGLLLLSVTFFPYLLVPAPAQSELSKLSTADRIKAQNDLATTRNSVRTTLVQAIGGALVLVTGSIAWAQVQTARRGQITDRLTKSVDQLGSDKQEVRIGGIYALNQVAETPQYTRAAAEVLLAYLKSQGASAVDDPPSEPTQLSALRIDMQAVIRILVDENLWSRAEAGRLDLSAIQIAYAPLRGATLSGTIMANARLPYADLQGAELMQTSMPSANLDHANLNEAELSGSDITGASFALAFIRDAKLCTVQARDTVFIGADLSGSTLSGDFRNANFSEAHLNGVDMRGADLRNAIFTNANLAGADFSGADLGEAILIGVTIDGVIVDSETNLSNIVTDERVRAELIEKSHLPPPSAKRGWT